LLTTGGHQLEGTAQDLRPLPRRGRRPGRQRGLGRADRVQRVLDRSVGDLGERLLGGRVEHRERRAVPASGPFTPDEQAGRDVDAGKGGQVGGHVSLTPRH